MKILSAITLLILALTNAALGQIQLTPDEFERQISSNEKTQLLDVRTPNEYQDGHLRNAKNINYKDPNFRQLVSGLDKNKPVYVYCLSGGRSGAAAKILRESGFNKIYDLKGGYLKWSAAGKKTEGTSASESVSAISKTDFQHLIASDKVVLVDFYAPWCAPCQKMLPTVKKLTSEYSGKAKIQTINYDQNKTLAKELKIEEVPTFLLYKSGKLVMRKEGLLREEDFRELLDANI
ncbi:thioredoxin domain-containing protein [Dyadobacter aurulentus]|uniref:thioredoxin domain-containing protein n=1 Tax=Dyadobacter sp. UC 10 TaxID=2605428 RepID=UPI0011F0C534|nr:thioredoxin domain-containing protein [Dyadobacter sp. UC 10]KAA0991083.1 thioredoxin fold domain-containing protein [Dyadobacter sp. UC 10]